MEVLNCACRSHWYCSDRFIYRGTNTRNIIIRGTNSTDGTTFILAGAIPIALIAIIIDIGLRFLEKRLDPTRKNKGQEHQVQN